MEGSAQPGFLGWVLVKSLLQAPNTQLWSMVGVAAAGLILLFVARFVLRSTFFSIPMESETHPHRKSRRSR